MKYRKKPIIIEAKQWNKYDPLVIGEVCTWISNKVFHIDDNRDLIINTLEGDHKANGGDYIIKGINGEFYPCKPDIFKATYEEVK